MRLDEIIGSRYQPYIVVKLSEEALRTAGYDFLYEGQWRASGVSDLWVRVDPENPQISHQWHAHVAHKKHIASKNAQVSWNRDGTRHDLKTFDTNFKGIEKAKVVARAALGLPNNFLLEEINTMVGKLLPLTESKQSFPDDAILLKETSN